MKCSMSNIMAIRYQAKEIEKLMNDDSTSYSMKRALVLLCATAIMIVCDDIVDSNKKETSEMTEEEWFDTLSTEEKARFFDRICYTSWGDINSRFRDMADYTDWVEWLKEKHTE